MNPLCTIRFPFTTIFSPQSVFTFLYCMQGPVLDAWCRISDGMNCPHCLQSPSHQLPQNHLPAPGAGGSQRNLTFNETFSDFYLFGFICSNLFPMGYFPLFSDRNCQSLLSICQFVRLCLLSQFTTITLICVEILPRHLVYGVIYGT